jgi:type II restriction/modification system DNA methylase subunit YeeA
LQNDVINFSDEMGAGRFFISVTPAQLFGIEINEYAHELAQMTIQIGYIQWLRDNGYGFPTEPILKQTKNILNMDAILAYKTSEVFETSEVSGVYEPEWLAVDVIIGNPPFLGSQKMRRELGDNYVEMLWKLYGDRIPNSSDLVCYWFEKARAMIEDGQVKRAGLLATQAIRTGANRKVLDRINETGNIFWAQSNNEWILDGASVRVSMVAFDSGIEQHFQLDGKNVNSIPASLSALADLTKIKSLAENSDIGFRSDEKGGPFDIDEATARKMLLSSNPNNRPSSDVVRPYYNAQDITHQWGHSWIIDFGGNMPLEQAALYEQPFEYVRRVVKPVREKSKNQNERELWWLHRRPAPDMRQAIERLDRVIGTPRVAKHRVFVWLEKQIIPDSRVYVFARDDDYFFGLMHSRIHEVWSLSTSSRHGDGGETGGRPTYNLTTCFETFPFPWAPGAEPVDDPRVQAIAQSAKELVEQRDRWLNAEGLSEAEKKKRTLTNLYNARPTWLDLAHKRLDAAVFAAYGWKSDLSDEEILEKLLSLNLERGE